MTRRTLALFLACGLMLSCGNDGMSPPAVPTGTFAVLSTSRPAGGTVALPVGFFDFQQGNGWVQDLTVTIRFTFSEPISNAIVFIVLWRGAQQCLVAEGFVVGAPYGGVFSYVAGSTVTQSGNSFTGTGFCRAGAVAAERRFTTDRLQFVLMDSNRPVENRVVFTQDLALGWRFE
jgi:hypothetical protein